MDKNKQLLDIAEIIREGVNAGIEAGTETSRLILKIDKSDFTYDRFIEESEKIKEKAISRLVSKWIPKTDFMQGDTN